MKRTLLLAGLLICIPGFAQDETVKKLRSDADKTIKKDPNDTIPKTWKVGGFYSLNLSQASLSNWAAGGDEFSFSINSLLSAYAYYKKDRHSWDNTFDFNLGFVNTTSLGSRKNDDRFDLLSKYGYAIKPKLNIATLLNVRSQFFDGYTYANDIETYSSTFFSPGYVILSLGIDYKPNNDLSIFISPITARFVIVKDTVLANKGMYGVTPGEKSSFEFGAFMTVNYLKEINKNITYKGRLDLFSNYRKDPQNIDIYMTNLLNVKLSNVFNATWGLDLIYDDDVRLFGPNNNAPRLQVKSVVGLGLLVKF
jgi:hypothetical protein